MHRVFSVCFLLVFYFFSSRPAGRNFGANSNAAQKSPRRNFGASANAGGLVTTRRGLTTYRLIVVTVCVHVLIAFLGVDLMLVSVGCPFVVSGVLSP